MLKFHTFCKSSSFDPLSAGRVRMFFFCFDDSSGIWNGTDLNFLGLLIFAASLGWKIWTTNLQICKI